MRFMKCSAKSTKAYTWLQKRLVERAKHNHTTLIIAREGQVVEVKAEELYPIRKNYRPQIR